MAGLTRSLADVGAVARRGAGRARCRVEEPPAVHGLLEHDPALARRARDRGRSRRRSGRGEIRPWNAGNRRASKSGSFDPVRRAVDASRGAGTRETSVPGYSRNRGVLNSTTRSALDADGVWWLGGAERRRRRPGGDRSRMSSSVAPVAGVGAVPEGPHGRPARDQRVVAEPQLADDLRVEPEQEGVDEGRVGGQGDDGVRRSSVAGAGQQPLGRVVAQEAPRGEVEVGQRARPGPSGGPPRRRPRRARRPARGRRSTGGRRSGRRPRRSPRRPRSRSKAVGDRLAGAARDSRAPRAARSSESGAASRPAASTREASRVGRAAVPASSRPRSGRIGDGAACAEPVDRRRCRRVSTKATVSGSNPLRSSAWPGAPRRCVRRRRSAAAAWRRRRRARGGSWRRAKASVWATGVSRVRRRRGGAAVGRPQARGRARSSPPLRASAAPAGRPRRTGSASSARSGVLHGLARPGRSAVSTSRSAGPSSRGGARPVGRHAPPPQRPGGQQP